MISGAAERERATCIVLTAEPETTHTRYILSRYLRYHTQSLFEYIIQREEEVSIMYHTQKTYTQIRCGLSLVIVKRVVTSIV